MAQELIQTQEQKQVQTAQALQVALARILELPLTDLRSRVEEELLDNAALEEKSDDDFPEVDNDELRDDDGNEGNEDERDVYEDNKSEQGSTTDEISDYLSEDDVPAYLIGRREAEREQRETPLSYGKSFYEVLTEQIGEHELSDHEREVMEYLIGSLDNDGLLRKPISRITDELAVFHDIETTDAELEHLLQVLQTFEPRGIGAQSLQECLLLQLNSPEINSPYKDAALAALNNYFKDFTSKHWDALQRKLKLNDEDFEGVINLLTHLNPAPGSAFSEEMTGSSQTVTPDFYITVDDDNQEIHISLNEDGIPDLRISPAFRETVKQYIGKGKSLNRQQSEAYMYAKQKVDAAQGFLTLIKRRNTTLRTVMRAIAEHQRDFFLNGDDETLLHPMALKDIAPKAGVDISTVSRVAASKYVQTSYGVYSLKFFFSNSMPTGDGEDVSSRKIKIALRDIIDNEDKSKPYSDEALTKLLNAQGFNIARRTVAKYRGQLGLPTGRLRK